MFYHCFIIVENTSKDSLSYIYFNTEVLLVFDLNGRPSSTINPWIGDKEFMESR